MDHGVSNLFWLGLQSTGRRGVHGTDSSMMAYFASARGQERMWRLHQTLPKLNEAARFVNIPSQMFIPETAIIPLQTSTQDDERGVREGFNCSCTMTIEIGPETPSRSSSEEHPLVFFEAERSGRKCLIKANSTHSYQTDLLEPRLKFLRHGFAVHSPVDVSVP